MNAWEKIMQGLDPARQLPAVQETRSAVVSAGAGSGKTRVLAVRYLHLVKVRHIPPERILCLTFTKKAATEMSERIRGMLASCAVDDEDFARALEAFPASRVSTLDSFCAELARSGCARWGVSPDFSVDKDAGGDSLDVLALNFLLKRRSEPLAASFIAAAGFEKAAEALVALAGGREGLIASERRFEAQSQTAALSTRLSATHAELLRLLHGGLGLDTGAAAGSKTWQERARGFPLDAPASDDRDGLAAARVSYRFLASLRIATGKAEAAVYYNEAGKLIKPLAEMAIYACDALLDERREAALAMLRDFVSEAADARAASGVLSFSDVASIALRTLETDLALRDWYKGRYDAIMVDEFQDDNELQKRILYCVAERRDLNSADRKANVSPADLEPGVLFFVGDEKQSIYAFRGADVTVFRGLSKELADAPGGAGEHGLNINWRSEPGLIEFFNQTFSRILPAPDDPDAQDFEARFAGLEAGPATAEVKPMAVYLESNEPDDDDSLSSKEAEAWRIAELVRSLVDEKAIVATKGPDGSKIARACRWEDIAVLFRSTTSQNVVERYFRLLGVPYTAASTAGLFAESILGDLYAMLRLAVYPDDRLAFATVLRGPFARLSDDAVFAILSADARGPDGLMGFDPAGLPAAASLPAADVARFEAARVSWLGVRALADREPIRRVLEYLWYDRALRWNVLKDSSSASFLEHFDYAWSLAAAADARGERLVDLVASLEPKIGKLDRFDEAVLRESSRGVSIMTAHMSKGLEFPVVILPDAEAKGQGDTSAPIAPGGRFGPSVRLLDGNDDPYDPVAELAVAIRKFETGKDEDAMNERLAETARLFYVACTRAISRLYLVGKVPRNADTSGQSFRALFLKAWPWAGPASTRDEEFMSDQPEGIPSSLSVDYVATRTKAQYARLANAAGTDGAGRAAASAAAPAHGVAERKGRWSVTGAVAFLEAKNGLWKNTPPRPPAPAMARSSDRPASSQLLFDLAMDSDLEPGLTEADFGTLCHQFVEARLQRPSEDPVPSGPVARALERLPSTVAKRDRAQALSMADAFTRSPRGVSAKTARSAALAGESGAIFETEYPFVWRSDPLDAGSRPVALSGTMDLVYGNAQGVYVIDFKTDRIEEPERHAFQLSVYREAAESIFGVKTSAFVFYLRTGSHYEFSDAPDSARLADCS